MIGTLLKAYSDKIGTLGYTENTDIPSPDFEPESAANKSFYLELQGKEGEQHSGNRETTILSISITILFWHGGDTDRSDYLQTTWDAVGLLEREMLSFSGGRGEAMESWELMGERDGEYLTVTAEFSIEYERELAVT